MSVTFLRGTLHPRGFAVVKRSPHFSKVHVFLHPGSSGSNLSLSAYFILSFPVILQFHDFILRKNTGPNLLGV